jgi:Asp-tRNA(Asn)/Glu-tRNA(Gln) amidotransferase A subunit family amidase
MQIAAGAFREDTVLKVAHAYEQASPWTGKAPPLP